MSLATARKRTSTRWFLFYASALALAGCASSGGPPRPQPHPVPTHTPAPADRPSRQSPPAGTPGPVGAVRTVTIRLDSGRIVRMSLDQYVEGAVTAETWVRGDADPALAEKIFEVQALVARTYAVANLGRHRADGFDLCSTTHCQLYRPLGDTHRWHDAIADAITRTAGQIILYGGAPILALFHANCGGATSAAEDIWGGTARPYLTSVPDPICARDPASAWRVRLPHDDVVRALDRDPKTRVDGRLDAIEILQADPSGRVILASLAGARSPVVRGEELRAVLMRTFGPRSVQGPRFRVRRDGDAFTFEGTGIGHGAGLCQFGAAARLRDGASPADVVKYYFPGTTIGRLRDET